MTSHKRTATEAGAISLSSAKAARLDAAEPSAFSRAQLDLADDVYRHGHRVAFRPVFLHRISTLYPLQWGEFVAAAHDKLSFDVMKYVDSFVMLEEHTRGMLRLTNIELTTIKNDRHARLLIAFKSGKGDGVFSDMVDVVIAGLMRSSSAPRNAFDSLIGGSVMHTFLIWFQLMFSSPIAVYATSEKLTVDYGAEYIEQMHALLLDAGVQSVSVEKDVEQASLRGPQ